MRRLILSTCLFLPLSTSPAQVVISEVMFDPAGPENADEFVELVNVSPTDTVRLEGWSLGDGTGSDLLSDAGEGISLGPAGYAVILDPDYFTSSATYDSLIPATALVLSVAGATLGSAGLSNSKPETVTLTRPDGRVEDAVAYSIGNVPGHSDERIDPDGPGGAENWADSRFLFGTPGFRNSVTRPSLNLAITGLSLAAEGGSLFLTAVAKNDGRTSSGPFSLRFFVDADLDSALEDEEALPRVFSCPGLAPGDSAEVRTPVDLRSGRGRAAAALMSWNDGNPEDDARFLDFSIPHERGCVRINEIMHHPLPGESEWIELVNAGHGSVDLREWRFSDSDTTSRRLVTDASCTLAPGDYAILAADPSFRTKHPDISALSLIPNRFPNLNDDADRACLFDPSGVEIDRVEYTSGPGQREGNSLERVRINGRSDDPSNWHLSLSPDGSTPGRPNSLIDPGTSSETGFRVSPNPFSPDGDGVDEVTFLEYSVPAGNNRIRLRVFDLTGRLIRTLKNGEEEEGTGFALWDGHDEDGHAAVIGRYIALLESVPVRGRGRTVHCRVIILAGKL
ncbi:MAG: lamin tail domain-containing protein [bacterium]|nr:lamin tail domain-containing protein [bacterium]